MIADDPIRWARLSPLIDELLVLAPAARAQRLEDIAATDAAMSDELRALLHARDQASAAAFLDAPAQPQWLPPAPAAGDTMGGWTLVEPIGEGGMGVVWRARRSDGRFEGEAAVKLLRSGLFDAAAQERFRREGAILARLRHAGIAQLLDAGITIKGQPFLVLELIRGERIDRWCAAKGLGVRACIELYRQVLDAVAAAHEQLVIHRDLKPSNILVDDDGRVKLLDFGIARLLPGTDEGAAAVQTALTREGAFALTPEFAAPEQFQHGPLSMATDVYALGVVLYALLAGAHPSGLPAGSPPWRYLNAALEGLFIAPSVAAPARGRELRGDLDVILAKACAADPAARYGSATALRDELGRHLDHEPIVARRATPWLRLAKLVRRRPFESAVLAGVVLAVPAGAHVQVAALLSMAAGTGVALWQLRRARVQSARAGAEQQRAEAVKSFIASAFAQAVPRQGSGGVVAAADLLHAARSRVHTELQGQPEVAAELMTIIGSSFAALGDEVAELAAFSDAVERCRQVFVRQHPIGVRARAGLFCVQIKQGQLDAAERLWPGLLADLRSALPGTAAELIDTLALRSYSCSNVGREDEAVSLAEAAVAVAREHVGPAHPKTFEALDNQGNVLKRLGRYPEALAALEPAVAAARLALGGQRPQRQLAALEAQLAGCLIWQGRNAEADTLLQLALNDQLALYGRETNETCHTRTLLAGVRLSRGDFHGAAAMQREALAADQQLHPVPTVAIGTGMWQLGYMLVHSGEVDEGLSLFERAEEIVHLAGGSAQVRPALIRRSRYARALCTAGRFEQALAEADAVLARAGEADSSAPAVAAEVRVSALRQLGRLDEADAALPALLAACPSGPTSSAARVRADLEAAELHALRGRWQQGLEHATRSLQALRANQVPESPALLRAKELVDACTRATVNDGSQISA